MAVHDEASPHAPGVQPPAFRVVRSGTFCNHNCDLQSKIAAPQDKNRSSAEYSQRTDRLAAALQVHLTDLHTVVKQSQRMIFAYRKGEQPITPKAWRILREAEIAAGIAVDAVEEEQAGFGSQPRHMLINPHFALPPASPTRGDVEAYVAAYLDLCAQLRGGWGFAYNEVLSSLPMEKVKRLLKQQTTNDPSP